MPTILVIDDDRGIRILLEDVLVDAGFEVLPASAANEALALLCSSQPDLIVLDLSLPDGQEALVEKVASFLNGTKLLVLSGSSELPERARALGAHAALGKPFEIDELVDCVRRLCGGPMEATGPSSAA